MGRDRSFDESEILEKAADAFSLHGYSGTSVAMLTEATGVGKQSLYNTFGDKEALYLRSVDCATARFYGAVQRVQKAKNGRLALEIFFTEIAMLCASNDAPKRVCIVSAGLLESVEVPEIQAALERKWNSTHEVIRSSIERGQKDGSILNMSPSIELADMMMSIMSGMRVAAKVEGSRSRLKATVALTLRILDATQ
jgi:TetR/AcrR family transcriptional regulator, transcriptional repressor for nem operon